ncbi:transposable element Tcb1 transposase [Trichonephila clavipes]|nr:transposable element Tcb1 transposase [Trichonephila clavipes]
MSLPFIQALRNPTFQQDNAQPHAAFSVRTFLDTKNVRLLPWLSRSSNLSPIENAWSMIAKRLARHHTPVNRVNELWHSFEAAWASVPVETIGFPFHSMPQRISDAITARIDCTGYWGMYPFF